MIRNTLGGLQLSEKYTSTVWSHGIGVYLLKQLALPTGYKVLSIAILKFYRHLLRWILLFTFYIWGNWGPQEHQGAQLGSSRTGDFHQVWWTQGLVFTHQLLSPIIKLLNQDSQLQPRGLASFSWKTPNRNKKHIWTLHTIKMAIIIKTKNNRFW